MHPLILLAKSAVETYIKEGKIITPPKDLPEEFSQRKSGVFVTIQRKLSGLPRSEPQVLLRGCIGTYLPLRANIAEEIIYNAVAAATEDYRFGPIQKEELPHLSYAVYILSEPELAKNTKELNPKKFGIIVKTTPKESKPRIITEGAIRGKHPTGQAPILNPNEADVVFNGHMPAKSGLLLPDLEGVDTVEKQISIACQKGGINPNTEKILIYKFTAEKYQ